MAGPEEKLYVTMGFYLDAGRAMNELALSSEAKEEVEARSAEYLDAGRAMNELALSPEAKEEVEARSATPCLTADACARIWKEALASSWIGPSVRP